MSIFIPFNHQPASVSVKTGSYSIPAGYYARVVVSLRAEAYGKVRGATATTTAVYTTTASADSNSKEFWVPTGTALNVTTGTLSISDTTNYVGADREAGVDGTIEATFTIGGTTALSCKVGASASVIHGDVVDYTATVVGSCDARYTVELYNELT